MALSCGQQNRSNWSIDMNPSDPRCSGMNTVPGLVRAGGDVSWAAPTTWLFAGGMIAVLAVSALAAYGGWRRPADS